MKRLRPKDVNSILVIALLIGAVTAFYGVFSDKTALSVIGIVIMICSVLFRYIFYRCPHCGKYLDRSTGPYCPYCREKVNDVDE